MSRAAFRKIAGPTLMRGLDAVRHELRYGPPAAWGRWKQSRETRAKRKALLRWFEQLHADPPDVLIGANISLNNGIRFHIQGIRDHSAMRVAFAPPDELLAQVSYHDLHTTLRPEVMAFEPKGIAVIHSHVYPYYVQWCRKHRGEGPLWVHTYHSPYFPVGGPVASWEQEINDVLVHEARLADVRLSVSRWQQEYLRDSFDIDTIHVPNGVDAELCDSASADRFHEQFELDQFVLYVGRDEPVKNPLDFVRLAKDVPDVLFVAIGPGLTAERIESAIGEPLPKNLAALGALPRDQVQDAIAACSALAVTSIWEGFPTIVLEGLLREKPIVVPDNAGCVEAAGDGRFAFVYEQGNLADLSAKTLAALSSGGSGTEGRSWVLENFDWKVIAPVMDRIYHGGKPE